MKHRPPRGFRDFPPEIAILRRELLSRLARVFEKYGFDPLETPAVEHWETLAGKYGAEAEGRLIWRFKDPWSEREYALRYDLTVPLARFISNNLDIPMPFKRYQMAPVWRHEEPQRGRYREFYQCDADIVGSPWPEADAEILEVVAEALRELGMQSFKIRLNDRRLLAGIFEEELGLKDPLPVYRAIDKMDKIGAEGVRKELSSLVSEETAEKIMAIASIGGGLEELRRLCSRYGGNRQASSACSHLEEVLSLFSRDVVFDMSLVRGLDYYTGPILEAVLESPKIGSVAGGGRYDDLIGLFAGKKIPATGASIGIERIIDAGIELGIYSLERKSVADVFIVLMDQGALRYAWSVARALRDAGVRVRLDLSRASEEAQRKRARRLGVPLLAFIGAAEASSSTVTLYNTRTAERAIVKLEEAASAAKRML